MSDGEGGEGPPVSSGGAGSNSEAPLLPSTVRAQGDSVSGEKASPQEITLGAPIDVEEFRKQRKGKREEARKRFPKIEQEPEKVEVTVAKTEAPIEEKKEEELPQNLREEISKLVKGGLTGAGLATAIAGVLEFAEEFAEANQIADKLGLHKRVRNEVRSVKEKTRERKMSPREEREEEIRARVERHLEEDFKGKEAKELAERIMLQREVDPEASYYLLLREEVGKHDIETNKAIMGTLRVLKGMANNPNKEEERVWSELEEYASNTQYAHAPSGYERAKEIISSVYDVRPKEEDLSKRPWWSRDFQGMLEDYHQNILNHMDIALAKAKQEAALRNIQDQTLRKQETDRQQQIIDKNIREIQEKPWDTNTPGEVLVYAERYVKHLEQEDQRKKEEEEEKLRREQEADKTPEYEKHGGKTFREALTDYKNSEAFLQRPGLSQAEKSKAQKEKNEAERIMNKYIVDLKARGMFDDVDFMINGVVGRLRRLADKSNSNTLTASDIRHFEEDIDNNRKYSIEIRKYERANFTEETFPGMGAEEWYLLSSLQQIQDSYEGLGLIPNITEVSGMDRAQIEELLRKVQARRMDDGDEGFGDSDYKDRLEYQYTIQGEMQKILSAKDQEELYPEAVRFMYPLPSMVISRPDFLSDEWLDRKVERAKKYLAFIGDWVRNKTEENIQRLDNLERDPKKRWSAKTEEEKEDELRKLRNDATLDKERLRKVWKAIYKLSIACSNKFAGKFIPDKERGEALVMPTNRDREILMQKNGVLEAMALMEQFLSNDPVNIRKFLLERDVRPGELGEKRLAVWNRLRAETKSSFYGIDGNDNFKDYIRNNDDLETFREAMAFWLVENKGMTDYDAKLATYIAWQWTYLDNTADHNNSHEIHPDSKLLSPAVAMLRNTTAWEMLRPQDRFEGKVKGNEAWGLFGVWGVHQKEKLLRRIMGINWQPNQVYPPEIAKSLPYLTELEGGGNLRNFLHDYGEELLRGSRRWREAPKLDESKEWLSYYQFDILANASTLRTAIVEGHQAVKWKDLGNAFRGLKIGRNWRKKIILGLHGVDADSGRLKPHAGKYYFGGWMQNKEMEDPDILN